MQSSSGKHYIALDHIRALAAFFVFTWHFTHFEHHLPSDYHPAIFPLSILDQGHTGVALFMTLSGYLFAKLLNGKSIIYTAFIWNRLLRLLPLLIVVIIIVGIIKLSRGQNLAPYIYNLLNGVIKPTLPNGAWSITVEFHFYLILPLLLWLFSKSRCWPVSIILTAIAFRAYLFYRYGEIQELVYLTIIGRIDQFVSGMFIYQFRSYFVKRHGCVLITILTFMLFYWYFDLLGGYQNSLSNPSVPPFWIIIPTIEGITYSIAIAWYDNSFTFKKNGISKFIGNIGEYSYSIYLLHFFIVYHSARFVNDRIINLSNLYIAVLWSTVFFLLMLIPAYISFRYIESPFLILRKPYVKQ